MLQALVLSAFEADALMEQATGNVPFSYEEQMKRRWASLSEAFTKVYPDAHLRLLEAVFPEGRLDGRPWRSKGGGE